MRLVEYVARMEAIINTMNLPDDGGSTHRSNVGKRLPDMKA